MLKLGFDIDEVMSKTCEWVNTFLLSEYGFEIDLENIKEYDFTKHEAYEDNQEAFKELFKKFKALDYAHLLEPYEDGIKVIRQLYRKGHRLYFISNRPVGLEHITGKWFRDNGIPFHNIYHLGFQMDKGLIGKQIGLDFYVDDRVEDIASMLLYQKYYTKGIFLMDKPWNRVYTNNNVGRVYNWDDIFTHITIPRDTK